MTYFIFGQDEYRIKERANELASTFEKKSDGFGAQKHIFDIDNDWDANKLKNLLSSTSLFGDKNIFIFRGLFERRDLSFYEILEDSNLFSRNDIFGIFAAYKEKNDCSKKDPELWQLLYKKSDKKEEITKLYGQSLSRWIQDEFTESGLRITPSAIAKLIFRVGGNTHLLSQEIEKLICYKKGGAAHSDTLEPLLKIEENDVENLTFEYQDTNAFSIVDALTQNQKAKAIELFHRYTKEGKDTQRFFAPLIYQFRNLLSIRSMMDEKMTYSDMSKNLKLHPFVMRKSYSLAGKFNLAELKGCYNRLLNMELNLKSGRTLPEEEIFNFIIQS